jgi:uncharacterized protein
MAFYEIIANLRSKTLQDPDNAESYLAMADTKPSLLLKGETPRLIDEWQMAPVLWDAVRFEVDKRGETGQFILTGSAVPSDNVTAHTGTGRISRLMMRPMSLFESMESNGTVSLSALFDGNQDVEGLSDLSIENIFEPHQKGTLSIHQFLRQCCEQTPRAY